MPRARSLNQDPRQTAAASENGSGCFSVYWMPPLAALLIACLLAIFALNAPIHTSALLIDTPIPSALTPAPSSNELALPISTQGLPVVDNTVLVAPTSSLAMEVRNEPTQESNPLFDFSSSSSNGISPIFTKEIQYWANDIVRWSNASSLDPNLVAVIMQIESCGDPRALSRSGAMGLFQVMPFHFHITDNPFNPDTNALRGLNYLSRSLETAQGNARLAMAGYNGGIGVISRGEWTWPAETHRYVRFGAPIYEDASSGVTSSATLEEWHRKYGAGLCRQASNRLGLTE
jgi:soluble lytic murein transglycosylase-like protein